VSITRSELDDVERANKSGVTPVVLVHGLWLPASSWLPWRGYVEEYGYATLAPGWPGEPETVEAARERPEAVAGTSISQVVDHVAEVIGALDRKPVVIGHSVGALVAERLAGMGLARATVAITPAPFRGVLPLPVSTLRATFPVLGKPANVNRSVMLTAKQFRFAFGNALSAEESDELHERLCVPAPGRPLFQTATANVDPRTQARVGTRAAGRGPLMVIGAEKDNVLPWAIAYASYQRQAKNADPTEITQAPGRGHALAVDAGWRVVADNALSFLARHEVT